MLKVIVQCPFSHFFRARAIIDRKYCESKVHRRLSHQNGFLRTVSSDSEVCRSAARILYSYVSCRRLKKAASLINGLESGKFAKVLARVLQKVHLKVRAVWKYYVPMDGFV